MARRPHFGDEPMSRLAVWSSRMGWFALAVAAMSVVIVRSGLLEIVPAVITFAAALACAALAILLAFAAFVVIWRQGLRGLGRSFLGLFLGLALLGYPGYLGYRASKLPNIWDITTDPVNPPRFDTLARLRPRGTSAYGGTQLAEKQHAAYPEVVPLQLDLPPRTVYELALALANKRKWLVLDARAPAPPGRRDGVIEAVARTTIMGFREDMVIRVSPLGAGSRVDMRSASRYGFHDFGSNAARVRNLLEDLDEAASNAPEPRAEPEPRRPQQPQQRRPPPQQRQPANR
ncbi:MAG: DUF1499 domain-containing protein [Pseudolabrys sp.]